MSPVYCDIIIPIWNQFEYTRNCIDAVFKHTKGRVIFHLILVDNGSEAETQTYLEGLLKKYPNKITLFRFLKNQGFPKAINQGLSLSHAPYICLLNNDVTVPALWLDQLCESLKEDKKLGALYTSQLKSLSDLPSAMNFTQYAKETYQKNKGTVVECNTLFAHCVVLKREVIEQVGLMDEAYTPGYWEDIDYGLRVVKAGFKIGYSLDTVVFHPKESSFKLRADAKAIYDRSSRVFEKKWGKPKYICHLYEKKHIKSPLDPIKSQLYEDTRKYDGYTYVKGFFRGALDLDAFGDFHRNVILKVDTQPFFKFRMLLKILFRRPSKQYRAIVVDNRLSYVLFCIIGFLRGIAVRYD